VCSSDLEIGPLKFNGMKQRYDVHPGFSRMGMRGAELSDTSGQYLRNAAGYVEAMFSGPKAALRPLYDALYDLARSLGKEIKISPGKTIVPIYRNHVIAQIKPSTRTRIDFGLALGDTPAGGRLIDTGGLAKKDRITHRIEVQSLDDIDEELKGWLRKAYERDA